MQPTTSQAATTSGRNEGYQVLNISNVNTQNEVVLNDETLLALIQQYPFLYNPHVRPHNDEDYDAWAWEQITKAFNRGYEGHEHNSWSLTELMNRWKVLQPIVRTLSKITNIKSLPDSLRPIVVKISVPMDEKVTEPLKKPFTVAQQTLLDYEDLVKSLPLKERRRLEAEMMELILNSELESKATIKLGTNELQAIEKDYNDVLKAICLDDLCLIDQEPEERPILKEENDKNLGIITNGSSIIIRSDFDVEPTQGAGLKPIREDCNSPSNSTITAEENEENLLEPLQSKRWVPLTQWRNFVRKCRVRIKRVVMDEDDDLPLAVIKREKIEKDFIGFP